MKFNPVEYQHEINAKVALAKNADYVAESLYVLAARKVHKIESRMVDFVDQMPVLTPLPRAEKYMIGVCHARGRLLTVLDLSLALSNIPAQRGSKLIALNERDIAICAVLASEEDKETLPFADFNAFTLGDGARFLSPI